MSQDALKNLAKNIELLANIAIIVVAVLLGSVLVKRYLTSQPDIESPSANQRSNGGQKIALPGVDWSKSDKTLVLAISSVCHFCTESAPFYRQLADRHQGTQLVAVLPQTVEEGRLYLNKLQFGVDNVVQAPLNSIHVNGTPTLMLVDQGGTVIETWIGKLPAEREAEVLAYLKTGAK